MPAFSVKNKKINHQRTDVGRRLTQQWSFKRNIDRCFDNNNSNKNRNKTRRDDDGINTMAHGYNNQLPVKLNRWSDRGDYAP